MSVIGKKPTWDVTGKYDTVDERGKKITQPFNMSFLAKSKADALSQANKFFADTAKEDPEGQYKNLRNLKATPIKD